MLAFVGWIGLGVGSVLAYMAVTNQSPLEELRAAFTGSPNPDSKLVEGAAAGGVMAGAALAAGSNAAAGLYPPKVGDLAEPLRTRLAKLIAASNNAVTVVSGRRSTAEQAELYRRYQAGEGPLAAPPGFSKHETGEAADLGGDIPLAHKLAPQFGLHFPVAGENWHIEATP